MPAALALAVDLDHLAYDCAYLALAMDRGHPFVTADERFVRIVAQRGSSELAQAIVPLSRMARP